MAGKVTGKKADAEKSSKGGSTEAAPKKPKAVQKKPAKAPAKKPAAKKPEPGAPAKKTAPKSAKPGAKKPKPDAKKPKASKKEPAKAAPKKPAPKSAKAAPKKPKDSKKPAAKKPTKAELEAARKEAERTLEEQLEEELSDEEIENFQIEKMDMDRLTGRVCDILVTHESAGMLQGLLWKRLKISARDGSRLALKLERNGTILREKVLEKDRWTYRLILKKTPISTVSIEKAPCLVCPVEQKCTLDGEISPKTCQFIEDWVISELKRR